MSLALFIGLAVVVGIAGGLQVLVNSNLNKAADLPLTSLVVNVVAAAAVLVIYLIFSRQSFTVLKNADWYAFMGGLMGVVIVMGSTYLIPKLGLTVTSSIIIVSQLTFAMAADHFGLLGVRQMPVDASRIAALLLMVVGIYLFFK
ncbi:MAG: DMT family transporter [Thermincola sp.]|nr:DMT family transporter [Thermincola sp.]MDT3702780.1 DMT family transporter [Thermincola sp.]